MRMMVLSLSPWQHVVLAEREAFAVDHIAFGVVLGGWHHRHTGEQIDNERGARMPNGKVAGVGHGEICKPLAISPPRKRRT
jgi:hypothetical protein